MNTEHWTLNTEHWTLKTEHWTLNTEQCTPWYHCRHLVPSSRPSQGQGTEADLSGWLEPGHLAPVSHTMQKRQLAASCPTTPIMGGASRWRIMQGNAAWLKGPSIMLWNNFLPSPVPRTNKNNVIINKPVNYDNLHWTVLVGCRNRLMVFNIWCGTSL